MNSTTIRTRRGVALLIGLLLAGCLTRPATPESTPTAAPTATPTAAPTLTPTPVATPLPLASANLPWWNDRVFYEVFVRSYYDPDGDGVGDLPGLIDRLDYLNDGDPSTTGDLGVTGLWLMPVTESPSYHGYDVVDYRSIDPEYGTNDDFRRLIDEAHQRGMAVIVDLVLNHTGYDHPWAEAARRGDPTYGDWYIFSDQNPGYVGPWGERVWHPAGDRYYYAIFWEGMPDLNYRNPAVTAEMEDVSRFWLEDMGADGFRLDAVRHLIEQGQQQENTEETHAWLEDYHAFVKGVDGDALLVGEIWSPSLVVASYVDDEVDIAFEFDLASAFVNAVKRGDAGQVTFALQRALDLYPAGQFAPFLTNHDQNRVMSELRGNVPAARVAASLLLTSPGVPFIYYGEEIGMTGLKPDEYIRTPMRWDDSGAGFTTGEPWIVARDTDPAISVAAQDGDPESLLNHYRALIALRSAHAALRAGETYLIESAARPVYALLRVDAEEAVLVLVNLSDDPVTDYTLTLDAGPLAGEGALPLFGAEAVAAPDITPAGGFDAYQPLPELAPYQTVILSIGGQGG